MHSSTIVELDSYILWICYLSNWSNLFFIFQNMHNFLWNLYCFVFLQVWSLVRRFDQPQKYKPFVSRCVAQGNLEIGSLREVDVKSGLPATTSTERLELLDDDEHILCIRIIGGDHRLKVFSDLTFFFVLYLLWFILHEHSTSSISFILNPFILRTKQFKCICLQFVALWSM